MKKLLLSLALITSMTITQAGNPFFEKYKGPHGAVPFNKIRVVHYEPAFDEGIKKHEQEVNTIVMNRATPDFDNTIVALEKSGELLDRVSNVFYNLLSAESNDEMMAISQGISPKMSEHSNNINLNEKLYAKVKYVYDHKEQYKLNAEQERLLKNTYDGFVNSGANLNEADKTKYRALSSELSKLTLQFGQNVLKETNNYELLLTQKDELAGLPESVVEAAAMAAKEKGKEGWLITLSAPSYGPFMKYSSRRDLREKLYNASGTRCLSGEFDNSKNIKRIAEIRLEIAKLMGKNSYSEFVLERRMAKNQESVMKLLNQLLESYKPVAMQEVNEVKGFAIGKEVKNIELMPWDWSFYADKLKDAKFDLNDEMMKPYFGLENVKKGVFGLATDLYGITFKKNEKVPVYHKDVEAFDVFDKDGKFLALLYTDFHPRAGKRSGAWMTEFKGQFKENGNDSRPHITIVMNFTKPTSDKPALLTYDEVETFLHEFGHALHGMFANTTYESMSGTSVYRDFVELPSQIMENWLAEKAFLDKFAVHYQTGEKIPAGLIKKINDASNYNKAYACMRQLSFGFLDMAWHSMTTPYTGDITSFERSASSKTQILPVVEGTAQSTQFSHIFSGGYAAGYYSYKWAEVLDADAFSVFKQKGIFNKEVAESFRKNILEKGGTEDPMDLYKRFRGQEPTIDALMSRDGMK